MRAETGMVFQSFNLFPHLTAAGNIMLGLRKVRGKTKAEARAAAERWLARVGLAHKADSLPAELSGGQQQRVGIARAVAMEPKILLLDEITSALDPELVGEVLEVVRSLATEGMTMLMVTHEIAFARDASNRIVFMADGSITRCRTPAGNPGGRSEATSAFAPSWRASAPRPSEAGSARPARNRDGRRIPALPNSINQRFREHVGHILRRQQCNDPGTARIAALSSTYRGR